MSTKDLHIFESGSGGEMKILNGDLMLSETLFQTIYLSMFGGNVEENTTGDIDQAKERNDWWGNQLFYPNDESKWFNSNTERTLLETTLNSQGRQKIEEAIKNDLNFLSDVVEIEVNVSVESLDVLKISIFINEFQNQQDRVLEMVWNNAKNELIIQKVI